MSHECWGAKFHAEQQWSSLNKRQRLTELRVICTIPVELQQLFHQPHGLTHWIHPNQSKMVNTMVLKIGVHKHGKYQISSLITS